MRDAFWSFHLHPRWVEVELAQTGKVISSQRRAQKRQSQIANIRNIPRALHCLWVECMFRECGAINLYNSIYFMLYPSKLRVATVAWLVLAPLCKYITPLYFVLPDPLYLRVCVLCTHAHTCRTYLSYI